MRKPSRQSLLATAQYLTFLLAVLMCLRRFDGGEVMLLCASTFSQILYCVDRCEEH